MTLKRLMAVLGTVALLVAGGSRLWAKLEQEQFAIESQLQNRIENILSKTLPPKSYLVTVKVEMDTNAKPSTSRTTGGGRRSKNPFQQQGQFVLPGVPQKKEFVMQEEQTPTETVVNAFEAETLVRRIMITILLSPDITAEQVRAIRDVVQGSVPFNPLRGDELDIQNSSLLQPTRTPTSGTDGAASASSGASRDTRSPWMVDRNNAPVMLFLGALGMIFVIFLGFLFGPVRSFLNRLLAVLPRVGEQAAYAVSNAPAKPNAPGAPGTISAISAQRANGNHTNGDDADMPFHFIREEHLNKLPIMLRQLSPQQGAIVVAYLPPEWASQILGTLDAAAQSSVMRELSQAREVPPEIVKDVEAQIKAKLPYLVGGADWIQSVYQLTQPQTQRALLGSLAQQAPDLAQNLRNKTFFFEDLAVVTPGAIRMIVSEAGYPAVASAIKDEKPEFRNAVLQRVPAATREIIQQELDLSSDDKSAMAEAKIKLVALGRRLLAEGRINLPERR